MDSLTPDELDVLGRVLAKPELQPFFFRKVSGLKWFRRLECEGFFRPENNLPPQPAKEKGYVTIPFWIAVEYLVKTADELAEPTSEEYAKEFLRIILDTTRHARDRSFSNYRTWWQFAKLIQKIPRHLVRMDDVDLIDYWLDDPYDHSLVATELGSNWLPKLLDAPDPHSKGLALRLLDSLFQLQPSDSPQVQRRRKAMLRCDDWHAEKISEKVAERAGTTLGIDAVQILQSRLEEVLVDANDDKWSSVWRRAIEDHEQDQYADGAAAILLSAYRDCLLGYLNKDPTNCATYVAQSLESRFETIKRVAVFATNVGYRDLRLLVDKIVDPRFFTSNLRHEVWHLLNARFGNFSQAQRNRVIQIILDHVEYRDDKKPHEGASSYWRAVWFAAIRKYGDDVEKLYQQNIAIAGGEPEHPDFSSYMTAGFVSHKSPYAIEELLTLEVEALVDRINSYKGGNDFRGPSIEGLAKAVRQLIKTEPLRYATQLTYFLRSDLAYVYELIEAYQELWSGKVSLPWDDVWSSLLKFFQQLVQGEDFWAKEKAEKRASFVANRHWIVGAIGRFVEAGVKSDEHAFAEQLIPEAEKLVYALLARQEGEGFDDVKDAVSVAINSPRGHALEALINLTLRRCRLADKATKDHTSVWKYFEPTYDRELDRSKTELEFVTLVANYLPNFLYISKDWTLSNLGRVFDHGDERKWRCAMQGYAYVNSIHPEVYDHLRRHGHLVRALNDDGLGDQVHHKVIENIAVAYLNEFERLDAPDAVLPQLLSRKKYAELSHLIWFIWTLRDTDDVGLRRKVFELWPHLNKTIDPTMAEGRKLASKLCTWIAFIREVTTENKKLILDIAPFADEDHSAFGVLENIARISEGQPASAYEIWAKVLEGSRPDYPDDAIRQALRNIANDKAQGLRNAKQIVDQYIKAGNEGPADILAEVAGVRPSQ